MKAAVMSPINCIDWCNNHQIPGMTAACLPLSAATIPILIRMQIVCRIHPVFT